ncbi:hypothetical protein LTR84_003187 [Exophiala bonariae]|uniref:Beta-lactamase-related domain-containing protein n=1 Tax=Exophiala bonariae TaxID=1690606 RepID=A0AAV9N882_9EURO|nr:hypothetical protein LTR84_003187 [Exophiala bonariae]
MHAIRIASYAAFSLVGYAACQDLELSDCSLLGPIYPMPVSLTKSPIIQDTRTSFKTLLQDVFDNGTTPWGDFDVANTSISLGVLSTQTGDFLSEYHHTGSTPLIKAGLVGGKLDADTLYRTGSIGKLLTVYTILVKLGMEYWSEPVTKFVADLQDARDDGPVRSINWSEVTLESLARQISGLPRDSSSTDISQFGAAAVELGLPKLDSGELLSCGGAGAQPCTPAEFLRYIEAQNPAAPSWQTPIYSNEAFQLLGLAFENITGESLSDAFKSGIAKPLGLKRTFWSPPANDSNAMVANPPGAQTFDEDLGGFTSAGGQWSSLGDLSAIGRSILRSSLLPPAVTRQWLKTTSLTGDSTSVVGMPFEIFRVDVPISPESNKTRTVDVFSKNGGLGGYSTWIFLSPDHEIGVTILAASPNLGGSAVLQLSELALATWLPAAEAAAREAAATNIAGKFTSNDGLNSSLSLEMIPDYKGLRLTELVYNGTDILALLAQDGATLQYMSLRDDKQLSFRAIFQSLQQPQSTSPKRAIASQCNLAWGSIDLYKYGGFGLEEFIVQVDGDGKATAVEAPALRTTFLRKG